jgi:hypothetical protein
MFIGDSKQTYQNIETIIIHSKSTDGTTEIAAARECKVIFIDETTTG